MLRESTRLEADYLRVLKETKASETDEHYKNHRVQRDGILPMLEELDSRGTTLSTRIKNYKTNLTALEGPVMDQIEGILKKIRIDNENMQRAEDRARQQGQKKSPRHARTLLGAGARSTAGAFSSSPLSRASSQLQDGSSAAPSLRALGADSKLHRRRP